MFIVIFVGIVMACFTLGFEYWWYKYRKPSQVVNSREEVSVAEPHHERDEIVKPIKPKTMFSKGNDDGPPKFPKVYQRSKF